MSTRTVDKWTSEVRSDEPVSVVARRVLKARLRIVRCYLKRAARQYEQDVEYVHQLRVGSRRAVAALGTFAELLPRKRAAEARKRLRQLRNAAGGARDLDVLQIRLEAMAQEGRLTRPNKVLKPLRKRRRRAQEPLLAAYHRMKRRDFKGWIKRLLGKVRWRQKGQEPTFGEFAARALAPIVDEFFAAATSDLHNVQTLHQMRIAGKKLRYSMEVFAGAFAETFRTELYPVFEEVQEKLGRINDHAAARSLFRRLVDDEGVRAFDPLLTEEERYLIDTREAFCQWWTPRRVAELRGRFDEMLQPAPATAIISQFDVSAGARTQDTAADGSRNGASGQSSEQRATGGHGSRHDCQAETVCR